MINLLIFILLLGVLVIVIDTIPQVNTWQARIKIGRFQNRANWHRKVRTLSHRWLKRTPAIPMTDNRRLIIIDMIRGNYRRSAIQSWQEAALVLGLAEAVKKTENMEIQNRLNNFFSSKIGPAGRWHQKPTESDHAILAYALMETPHIDIQKYRPALDETYSMVQSLIGDDHTAAYKSYSGEYRFVDTIGFICPFLTAYGLKFGIPEAVELAVRQITEYQQYGMMTHENIPFHTYQVSSKIPVGLSGWGRGLGWFVIGLIDTWHTLPESHPQKTELKILVIKTARSAIKFQEKNGGFHWLLFDRKTRLDSSTTASLAWFFTVAAHIPEINEQCLVAREKALDYLMSVSRRSGAVDFSQGDTKGIGVYSQNFDILPFTQGLVLRTLNYQYAF